MTWRSLEPLSKNFFGELKLLRCSHAETGHAMGHALVLPKRWTADTEERTALFNGQHLFCVHN